MLQKQKFKINEIYVPVKKMKELDPLKVTEIAEGILEGKNILPIRVRSCLLYTSPSPRDGLLSRMPSSA